MPLVNPEPYSVERHGTVTYVDGLPVRTPPSTITIMANYQPMSGYRLMRMPEGLRAQQWITIWSDTELRTAQTAGDEADVFIDEKGVKYQVHNGKPWRPEALIPQHEVNAVVMEGSEGVPT